MNKSDSIKNLAAALTSAQAEMPAVKMNSVNPFLRNKFADLGAVIEATRPVLAKHGLSISQFPSNDGSSIALRSIIMHSSGEWIEDVIALPLGEEKGKSLAQVAGSVITYLRRYSWSAICGVYADEDTDGTHGKQEQKHQHITFEQAMEFKTDKGTPFNTLTKEQLHEVAEKSKNESQREAARVIIAQYIKEGK